MNILLRSSPETSPKHPAYKTLQVKDPALPSEACPCLSLSPLPSPFAFLSPKLQEPLFSWFPKPTQPSWLFYYLCNFLKKLSFIIWVLVSEFFCRTQELRSNFTTNTTSNSVSYNPTSHGPLANVIMRAGNKWLLETPPALGWCSSWDSRFPLLCPNTIHTLVPFYLSSSASIPSLLQISLHPCWYYCLAQMFWVWDSLRQPFPFLCLSVITHPPGQSKGTLSLQWLPQPIWPKSSLFCTLPAL